MSIVYRNQQVTFTGRFFEDPAETIPMVPFNPVLSPSYVIFDPSNQRLTSGIGTPTGSPGIYDVQWNVPNDAELTTPTRLWKIEWVINTASGRSLTVDEKFEVREYEHNSEVDLGFSSVTLPGEIHRIYTTYVQEVESLKLTIATAGAPNDIIQTIDSTDPLTPIYQIPEDGPVPMVGRINRYIEDATHVYFFDTNDADTQKEGEYQAIWHSRVTPMSPTIIDPMYYAAVNRLWLNFYPDLRLFIDKIRKRFGTVQAYYDGDLYRCLTLGIQTLGQYHPNNLQFAISNFPPLMRPHLVMAAAFWALKSQQSLELDLQISFSGQTVSIDYDHFSNLEGLASNIRDWLDANVPMTKQGLFRRASRVASLTTRPINYSTHGLTYRISSGRPLSAGYGVLQMAGMFGLL